jgi:hypothetical protein
MSQENVETQMPRALRVLAGAVLAIAALPFLYLGCAFPIASAVSDGYQDDPYYMDLIYGAVCLAAATLLAWGAWRLLRPISTGRTQ